MMQINVGEKIEIDVEQVTTHINIDEMDFYSATMAAKLAKKHYEKHGYAVIMGADFESNMLLALNADADRKYLDDYTRVKLGRARAGEDVNVYCDSVLPILSREVVDVLLYLCRLCSYAGDPAFPDIILVKEDSNNNWELKYVIFDDLQLSQKLFLVLAKILEIDIGLCRVVFSEKNEKIAIDPSLVFSTVLSDSRALSIIQGMEEGLALEKGRLEEARNTDELASVEDEIKYLQAEQESKPFHLMNKWLSSGVADSVDIIENMASVISKNEDEKRIFEDVEKKLSSDDSYLAIADKKTEEYMRQKAAYFQRKFGLGPSRAKALLRFLY